MHFPDRRPDQSEERILPLINVVFLLLIFFMIAGSLSVMDPFEVEPPSSASEGAHDPDGVTILMGNDGRLALDGEPLPEAELLVRIASRLAEEPLTPITLKADGAASANQLVRFTQALYEAGVEKLQLLARPEAR
jgi:biopolymer transport protein ExbD